MHALVEPLKPRHATSRSSAALSHVGTKKRPNVLTLELAVRYLQCNYGESTIPLDKWFGSFRDGQSAQDDKISSTPGGSKEAAWVTALTCVVGSAVGLLPLVPLLQTAL